LVEKEQSDLKTAGSVKRGVRQRTFKMNKHSCYNRDDIIRMAREADFWLVGMEPYQTQLERFAKLVAAKERERLRWDGIHTCGPTCDNPACVAVREAVQDERERCANICYDMIERSGYSGVEHRGFENGCIACAEAVADEMHQLLRRHEGS
jgi:hypothetical protein